jgi:hypothetical protein
MLRRTAAILSVIALLGPIEARGDNVPVRFTEGVVHGFLTLKTLEGNTIADGDLIQTSRGNSVTSRLVFHFKDGSVYDETAVFSQRGRFRLIGVHLVQKGPSFPKPMEMSIDARKGDVVVRYTDDDGKEKTESERLDVPPDLANGIIPVLLKNVQPGAPPPSFSLVVATPKPRLIKLDIELAGQDRFSTGENGRTATHYVVKADLGGLTDLLATVLGKKPPDSHVWILGGDAPTFVKSEQALYPGGPLWRIELVSPVWPGSASTEKEKEKKKE